MQWSISHVILPSQMVQVPEAAEEAQVEQAREELPIHSGGSAFEAGAIFSLNILYIYMYTCSSLLLECGIYMSHVILPSHMVHTQELATAVHTTGIQEAGANQLLAAENVQVVWS